MLINLKNRIDRSMICKIRISAHELALEKGRCSNIPKNIESLL
jgi:hypothetical protein